MTAHQFRHAAAALILKQRPGEFEFVRRILGHRNVQTTIKYYTGLKAFAASAQFGKLIEERLSREQAAPARRTGSRWPQSAASSLMNGP